MVVVGAEGQRDEGDDRSNDKTETKGRAQQPQALRARLFVGHIADDRLRGGDVGAGEAVNDAGGKQQPERVGRAQHQKTNQRAHLADEQNGLTAKTVGQASQDGRADELHQRIGRAQHADQRGAGAKRCGV
ncbi:hypothetical protein [Candidatus Amarolinea dominans]|uniref:hypothetical protein n=1 Tax=Candidatus Amarolinea dominans TaxID=3140696 RepID=UPI0031CC5D58